MKSNNKFFLFYAFWEEYTRTHMFFMNEYLHTTPIMLHTQQTPQFIECS